MIEGPVAFVLFHECAEDGEARRTASAPPEHSIGYLRARERSERAAAKRATSNAARRAHQELAQHYAREISRKGATHAS